VSPNVQRTFGVWLAEQRRLAKITTRELARRAGVSAALISRFELHPEISSPRVETILRITEALGADQKAGLSAAGRLPSDIFQWILCDFVSWDMIREAIKVGVAPRDVIRGWLISDVAKNASGRSACEKLFWTKYSDFVTRESRVLVSAQKVSIGALRGLNGKIPSFNAECAFPSDDCFLFLVVDTAPVIENGIECLWIPIWEVGVHTWVALEFLPEGEFVELKLSSH